MEQARTRSRRRSRRLEESSLEEPEEFVDDGCADLKEILANDLITEISQLNIKIHEQAEELQTKRLSAVDSKTKAKEEVANVFSELRHLLETKEKEALDEIDKRSDNIGLPLLDSSVGRIRNDESLVSSLLDNDGKHLNIADPHDVEKSIADLKKEVIKTDQILDAEYNLNIVINDDIKDFFHQWKCISDHPEASLSASSAFDENVVDSEAEHIPQLENERESREITETVECEETCSNGIQEEYTLEVERIPGCDDSENQEVGVDDGGATANSLTETNIQPSAPPLQPSREDQEEEDPPPYWQAVGLSGPQEVVRPSNVPDLNTRTYQDLAPRYHDVSPSAPENPATSKPSNSLEYWHSFPSKRTFDYRSTLPVALSWDFNRICLGDRGNRKVKFFNSSGELLSEMLFNGEIHDVSFLEMYNNESRYIVSFPKVFTFCIISIRPDNSTKLVRSITQRHKKPYNCICRGPKDQTLVGGCGVYYLEPPSVDIITFDGVIKRTFKFTPDFVPFAYPKSVVVFSQFIIISDWKLNVVCVFSEDGSPLGQYTGAPSHPLSDPSDLTLDQFGNVMILDGQLPNIHVIDLKCSPIEVIKIPHGSAENSSTKLLAFDTQTKKLATIKSNGQLAIYDFHLGYESVRQGEIPAPEAPRREPVVLPLVEGMLPSTIENIRSRIRPRSRTGLYS